MIPQEWFKASMCLTLAPSGGRTENYFPVIDAELATDIDHILYFVG